MDSALMRKIEKAKRYAEQRNRIHFESLKVTFDGDNSPHTVHFQNGSWQCDCVFFQSRASCSHTMALEMVLEEMLPEPVVQ
jgi:hypothetical protein